ncbi:MAG TPA: hypothetical protein VNV44_01480 [Solirubrobacteraceae bacterium]|jgi:hypothetical protein|nr:hypothetical protein [Solirubrobacteraceae bacterium]
MRSQKLTSACAVALLALAVPAAATARAHHHGAPRHNANSGQCRVTLNVASRLVTSGETALAYGQGSCPKAGGESGQTVTVFQHSAGTPGYSVAGTATTDAHGLYQLTTPALSRNSVFYATMSGAQSPHRAVKVAAQVSLVGPTEGKELFAIKTGVRNAVTFTGTVNPNDNGATVVLQRQNEVRGRGWHSIGTTIVNGVGGFAITHVFRVPGASEIRVLVRGNARNANSASTPLSYDISQAQNPSLTIFSSLDPIPYQGSVVISGTAAGAAHVPLTLLARTAGSGGYKTVATTMSDGEGKYAFLPQTDLASTLYRVQGAGRSSAVLYEGVKYVLGALTTSGTSVQSGQLFSVSGTVSPASAGHDIWLQRQNQSGTGYHVVGVGQVAPGGSYTITHIFYAPGTDVLRVKIPGDPGNGGTATPTFDLTVTPVPTAKLKPEPPSNSNQPPVGQV